MGDKTDKLISELEIYFSLCPIEPKAKHSSYVRVQSVLNEVLSPMPGSYMDENFSSPDEEKMIQDIIHHCDDETQEELISSFGEESLVAQIIRKSRIEKYRNSKKSYYPYDALKENLAQEIRDIKKSGNPFYESVCNYMERIGFSRDSDFYNSIGMLSSGGL